MPVLSIGLGSAEQSSACGVGRRKGYKDHRGGVLQNSNWWRASCKEMQSGLDGRQLLKYMELSTS